MSKFMRSPGSTGAGELGPERLGGDDEAADRQHATPQRREHAVDVGVGRDEHVARVDRTAGRVHAEARAAPFDARGTGPVMDLDAGLGRRAR